MGNYLRKIQSFLSLENLTSNFHSNRGKKRKRSCLNERRNKEEADTESSNLDEESDYEDIEEDSEEEINDPEVNNEQDNSFEFFTNLSRQNFQSRLQNSTILEKKKKPTRQSCRHKISNKLTRPTKKKIRSTTDYIYETLFQKGESSDLVVKALGKDWHLHKVYLRQSPYFYSMFKNGSIWKESSQSFIQITIPDENINEKSLQITFGSFYKEEIEIAPVDVIGVLACASLFSLDDLLNNCVSRMIDNIDCTNFIDFYNASLIYSVSQVTEYVYKWLGSNLMINPNIKLADISLELFEKVLSLNNLMVVQVETDLYSLCKNWLFLKLSKNKNLEKNCQKNLDKFFKSLLHDSNDSGIEPDCEEINGKVTTLLTMPEYALYVPVFRKIRYQHMLTEIASLNIIYTDRIVPHEWIEPFYFKNWLTMLYIDHDYNSNEFVMNKNEFDNECVRFGRALNEDNNINWRWVLFF